ncbi:diaminobutyrate--2-oxoglutarate transaminase family protein [Mesobacillus maritimus]|uniref:aspartate aminotransferase family protein n=1 Tax=Mesobacillus maritimus TaxID=1643336 RepID=UPI00203F05BC|nr:diaminobutyrate--2-oxoglutarate transaminase family protein [Mesobacillus maritimus]MCM3670699.1 diaminobutyrate--2-oxoglutarate transaminase family protein [Mesobacillus maritimus]
MTEKFASLHFLDAPNVKEVPGTRSKKLLDLQKEYEGNARSYPRSIPIAFEAGKGATIKDVDGNVFIDFFGGAGTLNVGHSNPIVLEASIEQQKNIIHTLDFPTEIKMEFMSRLKNVLPGDLKESAKLLFGGPTGSDAVESAIKLSRFYTKTRTILSFQGAYHGMSLGALSVTSNRELKDSQPGSDVHFFPYPYCYRCPFGLERGSCGMACAKFLEESLINPHSGVNKPSAVIIEPIQGEGGTIVPPSGYLKEVRRITEEQGVILICDEIQTGFGRTGKMFASEHDDISPDMVTLSKALGGIGYPISCIAYDKKFDTWEQGFHIGTFRGHQSAMAAGNEAIKFMDTFDVLTHVTELGEYALIVLSDFSRDIEVIGDVRGKGLMMGIEFVKDRHTKTPNREIANEIRKECIAKGLIVEVGGHYSNVIRFLPPLTITKELLTKGLDIFMQICKEIQGEYSYQ